MHNICQIYKAQIVKKFAFPHSTTHKIAANTGKRCLYWLLLIVFVIFDMFYCQ